MEYCSRFWGKSEGCFGLAYNTAEHECWLKNSTTGASDTLTFEAVTTVALVNREDMTPLSEDCPAASLSNHTVGSVGYTVHCDRDIVGFDGCWEGYPWCKGDGDPFRGFYHATSLDECLGFCLSEHPLCVAVVWNPNLKIGYANCWPKTGVSSTNDRPGLDRSPMHVAAVTSMDPIDATCPIKGDTKYTAANKRFELRCGERNTGVNITSVHTQNITACIDACASSTEGCKAVSFDSSLLRGYQNCYLQNTTSLIVKDDQSIFAFLSDTPATPSPSPSNSASDTSAPSSSSKAWIAGPVIGGIAALSIIALGLFWWRRRESRKSTNGVNTIHEAPAPSEKYAYREPAQLDAQAKPSELSSGTISHELPTSYNTAK